MLVGTNIRVSLLLRRRARPCQQMARRLWHVKKKFYTNRQQTKVNCVSEARKFFQEYSWVRLELGDLSTADAEDLKTMPPSVVHV